VTFYEAIKINASKERERQLTDMQVDLIAKQRQEWMDSIRNIAAEFIADLFLLFNEEPLRKLSADDPMPLT